MITSKRIYYSLISFIISILSIIVVFGFLGIIGSGDKSIYVGDLYAQYVPFINNFMSVIKGENSFWYSFSNYLGSGNVLTNAYYAINPFNLLFLLQDIFDLQLIVIVIIILKLALSAFFFEYFAYSNISNKKFIIIISVFYSLSAFSFYWYYNIMWLDVMYIVPVLIMLILNLIRNNKYIGLIICYFYLFITNFYMGYIAGIFSALVFILILSYMLFINKKITPAQCFKVLVKYIFCVLLAIGLCSFVLLSAFGFLRNHIAEDNDIFEQLIVTFPDILNGFYVGNIQSGFNVLPSLYCGIPVIILAILFFFNSNIRSSLKVFFGIILSIYTLSMIWLPLYKLMHAFDYPNAYGFRFSFAIIFLVCVIAAISYNSLNTISLKTVTILSLFLISFYSFMINYQMINYIGGNTNSQNRLVLNIIFIVFWAVLFFVISNNEIIKKNKKIIELVIITACIIEVSVNGIVCLKQQEFENIDKSRINQWYYSEKNAIDEIQKNDNDKFYRIYTNNELCSNAASMFGYNSLLTFNSSDNFYLRNTLSKLGMPTSNRYINCHGITEPLGSMLAVKYSVYMPDSKLYEGKNITKNNYDKSDIVINDNTLPLGFLISDEILSYKFENNGFNNQENLLNMMAGTDLNIFENFDIDKNYRLIVNNYNVYKEGDKYSFELISDNVYDSYVLVETDTSDDVFVDFYQNAPVCSAKSPWVAAGEKGSVNDCYVSQGGMYKVIPSDNNKGNVLIADGPGDFSIDGIYAARFNKEAYKSIFDILNTGRFEIVENGSDYIAGVVDVTEDRTLLYTSIPYDPEWIVMVDGEVAASEALVGGAFLGVNLTPGQHVIEFQYVEIYSVYGAIISAISVVILALIIIINIMNSNRTRMINEKK